MGVLVCDRAGCMNVMCDHYSHTYGYICWECLRELKSKPYTDIEEFMNSHKEPHEDDVGDWEDLIDEVFKNRFEEED